MNTVWRIADLDNTIYVPRCSVCGGYTKELREHWFFTGLYCTLCIRLRLYDDTKVTYNGVDYES